MVLFLTSRGIAWVLEQPQNSIMAQHPRFQRLLRDHAIFAFTFNMQQLGAPTLKPTTCPLNAIVHRAVVILNL